MPALTRNDDGVRLTCRVIPGAKHTGWGELSADHVVVRLAAPPVEGKANKALRQFLAGAFATAPTRVVLEKGQNSRLKRVLIKAPGAIPAELMP
jgi:uncharacterized protein (TIGR00251 family)